MFDLSAGVTLRPTRIGFLTSPNDLRSIRAIMRACACLWGGVFNPIIPVFEKAPKAWRGEPFERVKGVEVAKGYVRFFEPDVYVEAEKGLLEKIGLGGFRHEYELKSRVVTLKEFMAPDEDRQHSDPAFGLNVFSVLSHIYKTDARFVRRDKQTALYVSSLSKNAVSEAVFGVFPTGEHVRYLKSAYFDVYQPETINPSPEAWRRVFLRDAETPLRISNYGLEMQRYWHHDPVVFVFDPDKTTDLIDLWNLRLEPRAVLPVPIDWFEALDRPPSSGPDGMLVHSDLLRHCRL